MKLVQAMGIAFLLVGSVAALPLASAPAASAQIAPQPDDSFDFDDAMTTHGNTTGMSFLAIFGASMVEGAEVTGAVMNSENEVSVTIASENGTGGSDAVTVVAFASTMDMMSMFSPGPHASLMNGSIFGDSSIGGTDDDDNSGPGSNRDDDGELDDSGFDSPSDFDDLLTEDFGDDGAAFGSSASTMGLFENIKTGSSVVQQGWNSPQSVTVTLVGNATMPAEESDTTFVFVTILPYTAETMQTIGEG